MPLNFEDADKARDAIMASQKREISALYERWADEIAQKAKQFKQKGTPSALVQERQMKELEKMLRTSSQRIANEASNIIKTGMTKSSQVVVESNEEWLKSLGIDSKEIQAAFSNVPDSIVRNIITGKIYSTSWSLSKSIWGDNEDTLKKVYGIVAGGIAQNKSIYDISKEIEDYVRPSAKKNWNLTMKDGKKIYPKSVDYNAQRLARTLSQHAYQQSILAMTKKNPFVKKIKWHATGSRVCPLCAARDGKLFDKGSLPMDHPNGMCTMEPIYDDNMDDELIAWVNGKSNPALDEYAKEFGFKV